MHSIITSKEDAREGQGKGGEGETLREVSESGKKQAKMHERSVFNFNVRRHCT